MVQIFRQMRFSCHFQNFAYFLAFSRYTFQNLNQRLHGICSQPLHDPWSTKKNNIITSSMKLLSIKYHFWSILAVFSWTFFIGPPNTKKKCITDMLRSVRVHWYHFHWGIKNFFSFPQNRGFRSFVPLIVKLLMVVRRKGLRETGVKIKRSRSLWNFQYWFVEKSGL